MPSAERDAVDFGPVAAGAYSEFREVPVAYRYAEIETSGPAGDLQLRPYDFSGEDPLPEGSHTYRLGAEQGRATLDLEPTEPDEA